MLSLQVAAASIVSTAAFLSLAAWAEGSNRFTSQPPLIALTAITAALVFVSFFTSVNFNRGRKPNQANWWVFVAFGLLTFAISWLPAFADRRDWLTIDGNTVRWIGVIVYTLGGVLRIVPVFSLGKRFNALAEVQPTHQLKIDGLYSIVRHPSYLGMLLAILGWSLAFRSIVGLILSAGFLVPIIGRIRSEEALLVEEFGEQYQQYCAHTWRLMPFIY